MYLKDAIYLIQFIRNNENNYNIVFQFDIFLFIVAITDTTNFVLHITYQVYATIHRLVETQMHLIGFMFENKRASIEANSLVQDVGSIH